VAVLKQLKVAGWLLFFIKKYLIDTSICLILGLLLCAQLRYPVVNVWGIRPTCKQSKYNFTFSFQAK
jgi:hypothetical protein